MRRFIVIAVLTAAWASPQEVTAPAFEVASVKANHTGAREIGMFPTPGRLVARNYTLKLLIQASYRLKDYQVLGATGWMNTDAYDIDAKAATKTNMSQNMPLLQTLLADRFHLKFHRETRDLPVYRLTVAKGGPKLQASKDNDEQKYRLWNRPDGFKAVNFNFAQLAPLLSGNLNLPVIDETGIQGLYDVELNYTDPRLLDSPDNANGISVLTAVQDQLGLKLQPGKGPVDVLMIDHAEKPAEN